MPGSISSALSLKCECLLTLYEMPWGHTLTMHGPLIRKGDACRPNAATRADSSEGHRNPLCMGSRSGRSKGGQQASEGAGQVHTCEGAQGAAAHCQAVDWREVEQ